MGADPSIDAAEAVALFRYKLIAEAANPRLGPAERGQPVRELASQPVELPDGQLHQFARGTFNRWLRAYREQGLTGLKPEPRADVGLARTAAAPHLRQVAAVVGIDQVLDGGLELSDADVAAVGKR